MDIEEWRKIFEDLIIIEPNYRSSDFISMLFKIKEGRLLYRTGKNGIGDTDII